MLRGGLRAEVAYHCISHLCFLFSLVLFPRGCLKFALTLGIFEVFRSVLSCRRVCPEYRLIVGRVIDGRFAHAGGNVVTLVTKVLAHRVFVRLIACFWRPTPHFAIFTPKVRVTHFDCVSVISFVSPPAHMCCVRCDSLVVQKVVA